MFYIPDVHFTEQMHKGVTVSLDPNNEESATITFDTDVVQGSITSQKLQLLKRIINALLRMITVTGQNEDINHSTSRSQI